MLPSNPKPWLKQLPAQRMDPPATAEVQASCKPLRLAVVGWQQDVASDQLLRPALRKMARGLTAQGWSERALGSAWSWSVLSHFC